MDSISSVSKANASNPQSSRELDNESKISAVVLQPASENSYSSGTELSEPSLTVEEIDYAVEVINDTMTLINRSLNFEVDEDNGRTVIKIIDRETGDLIKQLPSEDMLKLISHMQEMQSLLSGESV